MSDNGNVNVHIRERLDEDADYERPAILQEDSDKEQDSDVSEDESSEEESDSDDDEDEEAAMLTPAIDSQILRTIAAIQTKDPKVYDSNKKFFNEEDLEKAKEEALKKKQKAAEEKNKKKVQFTLKDYERQVLLDHGGYVNEEEEEPKSHYQEQKDIKNDFLKAVEAADSNDEEENDDDEEGGLGGGLLEKRIKTKEEEEEEDAKYRNFMLENIAADEASSKAFKDWNENYKENPNVTKSDAFLIDYVLNRGWVEKPSDKKQRLIDEIEKEVEEEHLDEVDRFESKYNFRFEEDGGAQIISHSRQVDDSVRRKESKRQKQRERKKAKKAEQLRQKSEEIARARNQKMKEIRDRLKEIKEITGNESIDLDKLDLDGDFDSFKYDEQMEKVFNEDYYEGGTMDETKPTWDDDIDTTMYEEAQEGGEEEDIMMDADYLPGGEQYQNKRKLNPDEMQQEQAEKKRKTKELLDDYYSLNFEDIIGGDLPTRYKYRKTEKESFGLTPEEILLADDTELNKYVGMKMLAPYRNEHKQEREMNIFKKNRRYKYKDFSTHFNSRLNQIVGTESGGKQYTNEDGEKVKKLRKRRGKKKKQSSTETA